MDLSDSPRPPLVVFLRRGSRALSPRGLSDIERQTLFVQCSKYRMAVQLRTGTKHHCCYV